MYRPAGTADVYFEETEITGAIETVLSVNFPNKFTNEELEKFLYEIEELLKDKADGIFYY